MRDALRLSRYGCGIPSRVSSSVRTAEEIGARYPIACWLNLVCLDAPLVAVSWQWLFAKTFRVEMSAGDRSALLLTAWAIYLADRVVDNYSLGRGMPVSLRQAFCRDHRTGLLNTLFIVAVADVWVILQAVDRDLYFPGVVCGAAAILYLALNARGQLWRVLPMKEVAVGALFSLGTALVPLTHVAKVNGVVAWSCFLFAAVCALNCISIATWECDLDLAQKKLSIATVFELPPQTVHTACAIVALTAAISSVSVSSAGWLFAALATSALLLATLAGFGQSMRPDVRTACADLALLTPWFAMFAS